MDKELFGQYKQDLETLKKEQAKIADLDKKREALEEDITSLELQYKQAETLKQKALQRFALGEAMQPEVEKAKKVLSQAKETFEDAQSMFAAVEQRIEDIKHQIEPPFGLQARIKETEKKLFREIYLELAEDLRQSAGDKLKKTYSAFVWSGGIGRLDDGRFLIELFKQPELSLDEHRANIGVLSKEYGI